MLKRAFIARALAFFAVASLTGCATPRTPVWPSLRDRPSKTPVVLIPGITGTQLRERDTQRVVWGDGWSVFFPWDGGHALARTLDESGTEKKTIEAFAIIREVRMFRFWKVAEAYGAVERLMLKNGYKVGDLRNPKPDDTFFFFLYDWRQDNVLAAQELARQLERLRAARGEQRLKVALICQSNAGNIARYFAKYGVASLDEAESGAATRPPNVQIEKIILVGTANGGSLRTLHEMNRGRAYFPLLARYWRPETLFTFTSLYQDLPYYRRNWFFDADGNVVDVNLYDADNWKKHGWSIFGEDAQKRLRDGWHEELFGDSEQQMAFLKESLQNAQRFHRLLEKDVPGFGTPRYYLLQNLYHPTFERALLTQRDGKWKTLFLTDAEVRRDPYLLSLAAAPGDVHASHGSQFWLSPQEKAAVARPPVYLNEGHFEIILSPATQRWLLEFLAEETPTK